MTAKVAAVAVALVCVLSSNASANPLSLSTAGVACTLDGKLSNSNPLTELSIAQQILDLVGLGAVGPVACVKCYRNSTVFDFEGSLSNPMQQRSGLIVPFGYEYALAKYAAGRNGGDVLFHVPTFISAVPQRRHLQHHHGQAEIEILPERAAGDAVFQIDVRGGDNPGVAVFPGGRRRAGTACPGESAAA